MAVTLAVEMLATPVIPTAADTLLLETLARATPTPAVMLLPLETPEAITAAAAAGKSPTPPPPGHSSHDDPRV